MALQHADHDHLDNLDSRIIFRSQLERSILKAYNCSSGRRLVDWEPRRSPHAGVDFWSLVELQQPGVCCDVLGGVAYPRSGDLVWLAPVGGASLFASASFCSTAGSPIVDTCTKGGEVPPRLGSSDGQVSQVNHSCSMSSVGEGFFPHLPGHLLYYLGRQKSYKPFKSSKALENLFGTESLVFGIESPLFGTESPVRGLKTLAIAILIARVEIPMKRLKTFVKLKVYLDWTPRRGNVRGSRGLPDTLKVAGGALQRDLGYGK
ncbi:hypothetical protein BHE74_00045585, partial [Ensete ventricosum]